jgi:hypothetical protein
MTYRDRCEVRADRLAEKIERLEAKRVVVKHANATYRHDNQAALKAMSAYQRGRAVPFPSYTLANFGAAIRNAKKRLGNAKKRLARLEGGPRDSRPAAPREPSSP